MDDRKTKREWKVVGYNPIRCPECGSRSHRQYGREGRLRYHKCKMCDLKYRSWEDMKDHSA